MKRYKLTCNMNHEVVEKVDQSGSLLKGIEWVKWADVKEAVEAHAESAKEGAWICPAHGYKRL